jgi:hypothetical protein
MWVIDNGLAIIRFGRNRSSNITAPEREFIHETPAVSTSAESSHRFITVSQPRRLTAFGGMRFTRKPLMGRGVISPPC